MEVFMYLLRLVEVTCITLTTIYVISYCRWRMK